MKDTLDGIKSKLEYAEEYISDLEDRVVTVTQAEDQEEKNFEVAIV